MEGRTRTSARVVVLEWEECYGKHVLPNALWGSLLKNELIGKQIALNQQLRIGIPAQVCKVEDIEDTIRLRCTRILPDSSRGWLVTWETRVVLRQTMDSGLGSHSNEDDDLESYDEVAVQHLKLVFQSSKAWSGPLLVEGPAGVGKTKLVQLVARQCSVAIAQLDLLRILGPEADHLFEEALYGLAGSECVLVDEADLWFGASASPILLLSFLSRCRSIRFVLVSSRPDLLHPSIQKHIDNRICVRVPDKAHRLRIWQAHLPEDLKHLGEDLAELSNGFVGLDIHAIANMGFSNQSKQELVSFVRNYTPMQLRSSQVSCSIVCAESLSIGWEAIGGLDEVKQTLSEILVWPIRYEESFAKLGISPHSGILLYGPPGTGKTMLASAVAKEINATFINISIGDIMRGEVGESEKALATIFAIAKRATPCVLFFDEIQAMFGTRGIVGQHGSILVSQLLLELDEVKTSGLRVVLMAATNMVSSIDSALFREGRFDKRIYVPSPDEDARTAIFEQQRRNMGCWAKDISPQTLASKTFSFTGADIVALCQNAAFNALSRKRESSMNDSQESNNEIEMVDFEAAIDEHNKLLFA